MQAYPARFYDRYFLGVDGDVDFYVDRAGRASGGVLEVGCGTGRVLIPMARASSGEVVGVDLADDLLAVAREALRRESAVVRRRVELVQGDMRSLSLDREFGLVLVPYRTFQHLLTPEDQIECLLGLRDHLQADGRLILDTFDPLEQVIAHGLDSGLRRDTDFIDADTGHQVVVCYSRQVDPEAQILEQELVFEELDAAGRSVGRSVARLMLRYAARYEMEHLLALCGFVVEELYGDFQGGAYRGWGEQVWVARRA